MNNQNQLQQQNLPRQKPVVITSGNSNLNYERVVKFGNVFPKSPKGILPEFMDSMVLLRMVLKIMNQ